MCKKGLNLVPSSGRRWAIPSSRCLLDVLDAGAVMLDMSEGSPPFRAELKSMGMARRRSPESPDPTSASPGYRSPTMGLVNDGYVGGMRGSRSRMAGDEGTL